MPFDTIVTPPHGLVFWPDRPFANQETFLFPGVTAVALVGLALNLSVKTASGTYTERRELPEQPMLSLNLARRLANGGLVPGATHQWTLFDPATLRNAPVTLTWPNGGPWGKEPVEVRDGTIRVPLEGATPGRYKYVVHGLDEAGLAGKIPGYDAVLVRSAVKITGKVIAAADRLQVIGRAGIGVDNIDVEKATEQGIVVMNTPDANATTTAELTFAHILSLSRSLPKADRSVRSGKWELFLELLAAVFVDDVLGSEVMLHVHAHGGLSGQRAQHQALGVREAEAQPLPRPGSAPATMACHPTPVSTRDPVPAAHLQ